MNDTQKLQVIAQLLFQYRLDGNHENCINSIENIIHPKEVKSNSNMKELLEDLHMEQMDQM